MRPNQYPSTAENPKQRLLAFAAAIGFLAVTACGNTTNHDHAAALSRTQVAQAKPNVAPTPAVTPEQAQRTADVQTAAENFATRINSLCHRQPSTYLPKGSGHSSMRCDVIAGNDSKDTPKGIYGFNAVGAFDVEGNIIPGSVVWVSVDVLNPGAGNQHYVSLSKGQRGWGMLVSKSLIPNATRPENIDSASPDTDESTIHNLLAKFNSMLAVSEGSMPLAA